MPFSLIPFLLLIIPIAEIAGFLLVGQAIGVWPTLGMILLTAIGGSLLLRIQGFGILNRIQTEMRASKVPARDMVHGVMIMIAGVLLLTPGFITDTLGFLLFIPPLRDAGWNLIKSRIQIVGFGANQPRGPSSHHDDDTIDLDETEYSSEPNPSSPWNDASADTADSNGKRLE